MKNILLLFLIISLFSCSNSKTENKELPLIKVDVKKRIYHKDGTRTYTEWIPLDTRTVEHLSDFRLTKKQKLSKYGGNKNRQVKATGFYRTEKIDGRWWIVDPDGYLFIHKAVNSINRGKSTRNQKGFAERFNSPVDWMSKTTQFITANGFNGAGSWSDAENITFADGTKMGYDGTTDWYSTKRYTIYSKFGS